jgi:hypothetical protein
MTFGVIAGVVVVAVVVIALMPRGYGLSAGGGTRISTVRGGFRFSPETASDL